MLGTTPFSGSFLGPRASLGFAFGFRTIGLVHTGWEDGLDGTPHISVADMLLEHRLQVTALRFAWSSLSDISHEFIIELLLSLSI